MNNSVLPPENHRTWSELPLDVTLIILKKLGAVEILESLQFVCKIWYKLCKEPSIWHSIRINNLGQPNRDIKHEKVLFHAIDRSDGRLIDLDIEGFGSDEFCSYFASRSCQLKRLRLAHCRNITSRAVIKAFERLSSLEELELTACSFQDDEITTFNFDNGGLTPVTHNVVAFAIAGKMPELRHLHLTKSELTQVGLKTILDSCPHLRSLYLRACVNLNLSEANLWKRVYKQIKDIQYLP